MCLAWMNVCLFVMHSYVFSSIVLVWTCIWVWKCKKKTCKRLTKWWMCKRKFCEPKINAQRRKATFFLITNSSFSLHPFLTLSFYHPYFCFIRKAFFAQLKNPSWLTWITKGLQKHASNLSAKSFNVLDSRSHSTFPLSYIVVHFHKQTVYIRAILKIS